MDVGEVRVAEDRDFELLKIYLSRNDGWKLEYDKNATSVWTRTPVSNGGNNGNSRSSPSDFKMIRLKTAFPDVKASVLYDVLHDPGFRKTWDKFMLECREIGFINPNNNISYYALSCPSPVKNRDFLIQSSWLETDKEFMIINHSVFHKDFPPLKGMVRGISYLTGFHIKATIEGCELGYVTHTNPKGNLPTWVSNKLSSTFAPKLIRRLHKACLNYETWKAGQRGTLAAKPWLQPEHIHSPRILLQDCALMSSNPDQEFQSSSPEESLVEDIENLALEHFSDNEA